MLRGDHVGVLGDHDVAVASGLLLAAMFFATSLALTMMAGGGAKRSSIFGEGGSPAGGGALPGLVLPGTPQAPAQAPAPQGPQVPQSK